MSFETATAAIEDYFFTNFAVSKPDVSIKADNIELSDQSALDEFVAINIMPIPRTRELMGATTPYFDQYLINVNIFIKENTGTGRAYELADTIAALFNEQIIGDYSTGVSWIEQAGNTGGWFQLTVKAVADGYV